MIFKASTLDASYNDQQALYDISFSMEKGEILCLLGTSGSGKTTLLKTIAGLQPPDRGSIHFQDQEITALAPHKRQFGMMFQDYALFPHKNVMENIAFGLQMQREPLGSLDRSLRDYLATELRAILKQLEMTTILVTHDQSEAFSMADRVAVLLAGKIVQLDKPENIYQRPATREVATFLGFKNFLCRPDAETLFPCSAEGLRGIANEKQKERETLLLRPEGAVISRERGSQPALHGKIVARSYLGAAYRIMVAVNGNTLFFDLPLSPAPPAAGEEITLCLRPETLVWLG